MSSIRPPHPDPLVDAARPPLASGVRVLGRHFYAHPDRDTPWDNDDARAVTLIEGALDDGGRTWAIDWLPTTGELVGTSAEADAVLGIATLDRAEVEELRGALALLRLDAGDLPPSWETVLAAVLRRRESNLGRTIRVRVEVEVDTVGYPTPSAVAGRIARVAADGFGVPMPGVAGTRLVSWREVDYWPTPAGFGPAAHEVGVVAEPRLAESDAARFTDTEGRTYVGSVDGRLVVVVDPDGSETAYRFEGGQWWKGEGEFAPLPVAPGPLESLLTRASILARQSAR